VFDGYVSSRARGLKVLGKYLLATVICRSAGLCHTYFQPHQQRLPFHKRRSAMAGEMRFPIPLSSSTSDNERCIPSGTEASQRHNVNMFALKQANAENLLTTVTVFLHYCPPLLAIVSSLGGPSFLAERVASRSRLPVNRTNERLSIAIARRSTSSSGGNSLLGWIFARSNRSMALSIAKPWSVLALSAP